MRLRPRRNRGPQSLDERLQRRALRVVSVNIPQNTYPIDLPRLRSAASAREEASGHGSEERHVGPAVGSLTTILSRSRGTLPASPARPARTRAEAKREQPPHLACQS